jgi:hypothetical protein
MKFNKIRPLLILAFVVGSFPLQSADYVPETKFTSATTSQNSPCDHGGDEEGGGEDTKKTRSIASKSSCL